MKTPAASILALPSLRYALWLLLTLLLFGCATSQAFREGQALLAQGHIEPGLQKLETAVHDDPDNTEYRITLANQRLSSINRLIALGEQARRSGRLEDAEAFFRRTLALDANNAMARQGLTAVEIQRRHRHQLAEVEALFDHDPKTALATLRQILTEDPGNAQARTLQTQLQERMVATQKISEQGLSAAFQKPIDLEFRDTPLKTVMEVISRISGLNFFYDRDINPNLTVNIFVRQSTIDAAMRLILATSQLEYRVLNDNTLLIYPKTPQKLREYQNLAIRSFYLTNADPKLVANSIKTLVKTKDLIVDERLGVIIMRDTPEAIRVAEKIVRLQDLTDPEVMLEVEILEVQRNRLLELGVQWPGTATLSPLLVNGAPLTLENLLNLNRSTIQTAIGGVTINANKQDQDGNILANPRIRVRNREKAKIQIGDRVPVITTTSTSTGFVSESVNYLDVGLKLEVEPTIHLNDEVAIKINLEVSTLGREIKSATGTVSYQIGTRGANTVLRLKDGETQILAGLINNEERMSANKLPLLGDLPIAGRLFGNQKDEGNRSEILLSITPHIVRAIRHPDLMEAEFDSGTEGAIGVNALRLAAVPPPNADKAAPEDNATTDPISLRWNAPAEIPMGESFSVDLQIDSPEAIRRIPLVIALESQFVELEDIREGSFFQQTGGESRLDVRRDDAAGRVYVTISRTGEDADVAGVLGEGRLLTLQLKAIKANPATRLSVVSAAPEPAPKTPVVLPEAISVRIMP